MDPEGGKGSKKTLEGEGKAPEGGEKEEKKPSMDEAIKSRIQEGKKVTVHFRASGGNTPILKRKKFKVKATHQFSFIIAFLRRNLKLKESHSLFYYIAQSFSPSPEECIEDLFNCFKLNDELVVNYCTTNCWG
ncbi:hypothetical protein AAMO2058_000582400 [Amorphochlora amoebiformis]